MTEDSKPKIFCIPGSYGSFGKVFTEKKFFEQLGTYFEVILVEGGKGMWDTTNTAKNTNYKAMNAALKEVVETRTPYFLLSHSRGARVSAAMLGGIEAAPNKTPAKKRKLEAGAEEESTEKKSTRRKKGDGPNVEIVGNLIAEHPPEAVVFFGFPFYDAIKQGNSKEARVEEYLSMPEGTRVLLYVGVKDKFLSELQVPRDVRERCWAEIDEKVRGDRAKALIIDILNRSPCEDTTEVTYTQGKHEVIDHKSISIDAICQHIKDFCSGIKGDYGTSSPRIVDGSIGRRKRGAVNANRAKAGEREEEEEEDEEGEEEDEEEEDGRYGGEVEAEAEAEAEVEVEEEEEVDYIQE